MSAQHIPSDAEILRRYGPTQPAPPQPLTSREFVRLSAVLGPARAWETVRDDLRPDLELVRVYAIQQANPYGDVRAWKDLADVAEWAATQLERSGR